ncbi:BTAD domain-containing putative transcriptional regulator [Nonomuraea fuscirosea]|uniref:AfsR/SARP family transcriptional regulator n=1 Tax=Nonomuraea fuscirosea TaxID=1291556 RepID=UPI0037B93887
MRLRQILGQREVILTVPGGYLARLRTDELDLLQFRRLLQKASRARDPETERRLLHQALGLWRGPVCVDIASETLQQLVVPPLAELRLNALELRIAIDADLGEDATLITESRALTAEHPFRERLWAQLMTALFRAGRQAEALETYRTVFRKMRDELGISPGAELRHLHQYMLMDALCGAPAVVSVPPVPVPPRQLPADVPVFVGRTGELTELTVLSGQAHEPTVPDCGGRKPAVSDGGAGAGAVVIATIDGMADVGKTALAVHAAHVLAPRFPDGQVFVDLHGHSQDTAPLDPADALDRLLRAWGLTGERIPAHLDDRAGLYRSLLAGRRVLIVLDDAASEAQIRPLLPGGAGCHVLITSRRRLTGLDTTQTLSLDVLPAPDAITLFIRTAGERRLTGASRRLLATAAEQCGRLPLAVRFAAVRLRSHPTGDLAHLVYRLGEDRQLLEALDE